MFVKCANCGYLTSDSSSLCKHCGTVVGSPVEAPAEPEPAAKEPSAAAAAWLAAAVPTPESVTPGPGLAPPAPPSPPAAPAPAMFPEPGARPARRSLPTWSFVTGAVVVVIVVLVAVLATQGGDGSGTAKLRDATADADRVAAHVAALDASLITIADLGSKWDVTHHGGMSGDDLRWTDDCDHAPGLESTAQLGRSIDFSYDADPKTGTEAGHALMRVWQYPSQDDAAGQYAARADAAFTPCVTLYDVTNLVDAGGGDIVPGPVARVTVAGADAVVYRDTLDYTFMGQHKQLFVTRAYVTEGRDLALLTIDRCCQDFDPTYVADLVRTVAQRLAVHAAH